MRAALYLRVSTEQQAERFSLPAQRRQLTEFCERQGWTYEIYEDAGLSGETIEARPAMRRLLEDALAHNFDVVLAVEMERFSRARDGIDLAVIKRVFRDASVRFGTPAQLFDPEDVEDDFVSGLLGLLAAREKAKTIERTSRGRVEAARRGRFVAGHVPYGYQRTSDGHLVSYEPEAEGIRLMFQQVAVGRSLYGIVDDLNARGIRPRRAGRWTKSSVWAIFKNPAYAGTAYYRRTRIQGGRRRTMRPEQEWIRIPVPRIVDHDLVHLVQDRLRANARLAARNQRHFWLLRGLVYCGICGHSMGGKIADGYRFYCCQATRTAQRGLKPRCRWHAVSSRDLDGWIWEQVVQALESPALILEEARKAIETGTEKRDELSMRLTYLEKALSALPLERERTQTMYREGYATLDELKAQLLAADRKRDTLSAERDLILSNLGKGAVGDAQAARIDQIVSTVRGRLNHLTDEERFNAIHAVVERIVVHRDRRIEISACVPLGDQSARCVRAQWDDGLAVASISS